MVVAVVLVVLVVGSGGGRFADLCVNGGRCG